MASIQITSTNYNGQTAQITFYSVNAPNTPVNLGPQTLPYSRSGNDVYGSYELNFTAYNKICVVTLNGTTTTTTTTTAAPTTSTSTTTAAPTTTTTTTAAPGVQGYVADANAGWMSAGGTYCPVGTYGGAPFYSNSPSAVGFSSAYYAWKSGGSWYLTYTDGPGNLYGSPEFYASSNSNTIPLTGWTSVSTGDSLSLTQTTCGQTTTTTTAAPTTTTTSTTTASPGGDPYFDQVMLLSNFDSNLSDSSNYNLSYSDLNASYVTSNNSKWGNGSLFFNGGYAFYILDHAIHNEFTIEAWVYRTGSSDAAGIFQLADDNISTTRQGTPPYRGISRGGSGIKAHVSNGNWYLCGAATSTASPLNTWQHIALCGKRLNDLTNNSTYTLYVDGVAAGTFNDSGSTSYNSNFKYLVLGIVEEPWNIFPGYIDELRVSSKIRYTGNFTPPADSFPTTQITTTTTPPPEDPYYQKVEILLHCNADNTTPGQVKDSSYRNRIVYASNCGNPVSSPFIISNDPALQSPIGNGVLQLNAGIAWGGYSAGNCTGLVATGSGLNIGTADYTLEFYWYNNGNQGILIEDVSPYWNTGEYQIRVHNDNGTLYLSTFVLVSDPNYYYEQHKNIWTANINSTIGSWSHFAISRSSGITKLFINGQRVVLGTNQSYWGNGLSAFFNNTDADPSSPSYLPAYDDMNFNFPVPYNFGGYSTSAMALFGKEQKMGGYIDELRFTVGLGRYNSNFTPPTSPYPSTGPIIGPDAPTALSVTTGDSQVSLSWTAPVRNGGATITDYNVQYSNDNGSTWNTFSDGTSTSASATITGLTNGSTYKFRVAGVNSGGIGDYVVSSNFIPNPPIVVSSQPLNNYATNSSQNITYSVTASGGGGSINYQWQYFGPDEYNGYYNDEWRNISGATASSYVTNGNTLSNLIGYNFYYSPSARLRCFLSVTGGSPVYSDVVRFIQLDYLHQASPSWYNGSNGSGPSWVNGSSPQTMSPGLSESIKVNVFDYGYGSPDTSWYTGNDTTIKIQVATTGFSDSADWSDLYSSDFRGYFNGLYDFEILPSTGTKYYRAIMINKWPYSVNNSTSSATYATNFIYPKNTYDTLQVTWPSTTTTTTTTTQPPAAFFQIPTMTSATSPSGNVYSSSIVADGQYPRWADYGAFDNNESSLEIKSAFLHQGGYLRYDFANNQPSLIRGYSITARLAEYINRTPKSWTLHGSNNGTDWTLLDTQTGYSWPRIGDNIVVSGATQNFYLPDDVAYSRYKWTFTESFYGGAELVVVEEIKLLAVQPTTTTTTTTAAPSNYADGYYLGCPSFTFSGLTGWLSNLNGTYRAWGTMTNNSWYQEISPLRYLKVDNSNNIITGIELKYENGTWYFDDGSMWKLFNYTFTNPASVPLSGWLEYCGQVDPSCTPPEGLSVTQDQNCSGYIAEFIFPW